MSKDQKWEVLDVAEAVRRRNKQSEQTMSGNAGAFAVPLGPVPLRRGGVVPPEPMAKKKKR